MTFSHLRYTALAIAIFACLTISSSAQLASIAGTGEKGYTGDGGPADSAQINNPFGVIVGPDGDIYFCDTGNHTIRKISRKSGKITTVAGTGEQGYSGDGGPAVEAQLFEPYELRFHPGGDLYWVEMQNHIVRRLDALRDYIASPDYYRLQEQINKTHPLR